MLWSLATITQRTPDTQIAHQMLALQNAHAEAVHWFATAMHLTVSAVPLPLLRTLFRRAQ